MKQFQSIMIFAFAPGCALRAEVTLEHVPGSGVQPEVAVAADGTVHLVYLKGDAKSSDVRHTRKAVGSKERSAPLTVNSEPGSAIAVGTIRGARIALGKDGSVHVAWSGAATKRGSKKEFYSVLNNAHPLPAAFSFTPQCDLLRDTRFFDGGACAVANLKVESGRRVFLVKSSDNGVNFAAPRKLNEDHGGVCACYSLTAPAKPDGGLPALYRSVGDISERAISLLGIQGTSIPLKILNPWKIGVCLMSSGALVGGQSTPFTAREMEDRIYYSKIGGKVDPRAGIKAAPSPGASSMPTDNSPANTGEAKTCPSGATLQDAPSGMMISSSSTESTNKFAAFAGGISENKTNTKHKT